METDDKTWKKQDAQYDNDGKISPQPGAILCNEGRFDEAVDTLCAAISIKEQPYTRYQLSQAYLGKEDPEKALEEISHAIALDNR